ncbi:MAG TPA: flap endonuclease-1 [Thermoplasmata archaeon]|nr:flap endonuclease-1 [Thermoplasmata archaeon]
MGVDLGPIVVRRKIPLESLRGKTLAVDASIELYQFLSIMRLPDGSPLKDSQGHVTSHLNGILFRTGRLMTDHGIRFVFVFDGEPPELKLAEIAKRREAKAKARRDYEAAVAAGDTAKAWSKLVMTTSLTDEMTSDAQRLLDLMGVPWLQAPEEAEAQCAFMAARGDCWAASSKDFDTLLFGAPRVSRFVGIAGKEFLPSQGAFRKVEPEIIDLKATLDSVGLTREQLVDAAILIGTDFNEGIKGIGPKTAVKLLRGHGTLEALPNDTRAKLPPNTEAIREYFLSPPTTTQYRLQLRAVDAAGLDRFLCGERDFSRDRVGAVIRRLRETPAGHRTLEDFG